MGARIKANDPVVSREKFKLLIPHGAIEKPAMEENNGRLAGSGDLVVDLTDSETGDAGFDLDRWCF
jgi:hypothetical protein